MDTSDNKDDTFRKQAASELIDILKKNPLLENLTLQVIESQDFMRVYQTLSDFEKQLLSIFLALNDNLE